MKYFLTLIVLVFFSSCRQTCSCTTKVETANGTNISVIQSVEETPASGNCNDLFFSNTDISTGYRTERRCQ